MGECSCSEPARYCTITFTALALLSGLHLSLAADCMTGSGILDSTVIQNTCYWTYSFRSYTTWDSAIRLCQSTRGGIAGIPSSQANTELADWLTIPAFFGYSKDISGIWSWVNSTSTYVNSFTDSRGVHMTLQVDGSWSPSNVDAVGHVYHLLCALDRIHQNCSDVSSTHSVRTRNNPMYSGDEVTVTCNSGYHVYVGLTVQSATCLPGGHWSSPPIRDCVPIQCDLFDPPAYTARNSERHSRGDEVIYNCTEPNTYFFPGVSRIQVECGVSGEWVPNLRPCEFLRCDPPPILDKGVFDNSITLYGNSITYSCLPGYRFTDEESSKTITCRDDPPEWDSQAIIDSLNCTAIYCPDNPVPGALTYASNTDRQVGARQVHWCFSGDEHRTGEKGTTAVCLEDPNPNLPGHAWDRSIPDCLEMGCDGFVVENATANAISVKYPLGYPLKYTCDPDSYFPGGATKMDLTCLDTGMWNFQPPTSGCDESKCEEGWLEFQSSCYFISDPNSRGLRYEFAEIQCNYRVSNLALITSAEEAAWIASVTYDVSGKDYWIGYHKDTNNQWIWKGNIQTAYINFADGYPENFDCARTSVDGYWKDRHCDDFLPYICKKVSICGSAPKITNGAAVYMPTFPVNVGTQMTYRCDDGFMFSNNSIETNITCMNGGYWSLIGNCIPGMCERINTAVTLHGAYFDTTKNHVGAKITFTCQNGLLFENHQRTTTIECLQGGVWSELPGECEDLACPKPASPDTTGEFGYNHYGAMDYYRCEPGFSFPDGEIDKLFSCLIDGTWEPKDQTCIRRACPRYSLPFAKVEPQDGVFEDVITVTCIDGYEFPDTFKQKKLTCTAAGTWSEELQPCISMHCAGPTPPNVTNAYRSTDATEAGTVVIYKCDEPLVFINGDTEKTVTCDIKNLQWSAVPTPCVETAAVIKTEHYHPPVEAENAVTFGTIGFVVMGTFLGSIVAFDLFGIKRIIAQSAIKCDSVNEEDEEEFEEEISEKV